jgi:hypothetical protein
VTRTEADAAADAIGRYQAQLDADPALQHPDPGEVESIAAVLGPVRLRIARDKARKKTIETGTDKHATHPGTPPSAQLSRSVNSDTAGNGETKERGLSGDR